MKKGFTLIELLSVIAILAIIILIALPSVLDVLENAKIKAYQDNELMMNKAAENYLTSNRELLPQSVGETVELTLNELKTSKYISEVADSEGLCNGYILVTKLDKGYSYNPQLKCGSSNTIGDSTSDGLIAHYTFDDFQEPTENFFQASFSYAGNASQEKSSFEVMGLPTYKYFMTYLDNQPYGHLRQRFEMIEGEEYTATFFVYDPDNKYSHSIFYDHDIPIDFTDYYNEELIDQDIKRITVKGTAPRTGLSTHGLTTYWNNDGSEYGEFWVSGIQIEKKSYSTPYTENIRNDAINDYSKTENSIVLFPDSTPKWINKNDNGYYQFDGNEYAEDSWNYSGIDFTISYWVNSSFSQSTPGIVSFTGVNGYRRDVYILNNTKIRAFIYNGVNNLYGNTDEIFNMNDGKWHNIVLTYNGINSYAFVDGIKYDISPSTVCGPYPDSKIKIGALNLSSMNSNYYYKGYIDEVKIYDRALEKEEIKYQYDISKYKYK